MHSPISYKNISLQSVSLVMIWKTQLRTLPDLDPNISRNFFDSPEHTTSEITKEGLKIIRAISPIPKENYFIFPVSPYVALGYERFILANLSVTTFLASYEKIFLELAKNKLLFTTFIPRVFGVNIEYSIQLDEAGMEGFKFRFNPVQTSTNGVFPEINLKEVQFNIKEKDNNKEVNVKIQPRLLETDTVYFRVNDHYGITPFGYFPTSEEVADLLDRSQQKFKDKILPTIL